MKAILAAVSLFAASAQAGTVLWSGIFNSSFTTATFDKCESGLFEPLSLFTFIFFYSCASLVTLRFWPKRSRPIRPHNYMEVNLTRSLLQGLGRIRSSLGNGISMGASRQTGTLMCHRTTKTLRIRAVRRVCGPGL